MSVKENTYSFLGFNSNPFENNTAEREPEIHKYAVHPPYLDRVYSSSSKGIFVLYGPRGSGKSATRITVAKKILNDTSSSLLVVPLVSFNVFRPFKENVSLELLSNQVSFLVIQNVLAWLTTLDEVEREKLLKEIKGEDLKLVDKLIANFYLSRSDDYRNSSNQETFELLDFSVQRKSSLWMHQRWGEIAGLIGVIAGRFSKKKLDVDLNEQEHLTLLLKSQRSDGFVDPVYTFAKAVEFAKIFGFSGVLVQVDKVDDHDWTNNNSDLASRLIYPLLSNTQLHEIEGLSWSFFIWNKIKENLSDSSHSVRWDKIPNGSISWKNEELLELIRKRLDHFSDGKLSSLDEISEVANDKTILEGIINLSQKSPRKLITLLDTIMSEFIQRSQGVNRKLNLDDFEYGMDVYAKKGLSDDGLLEDVQQIIKVGRTSFITKDVSHRFAIGAQASRAKINKWQDLDLIKLSGSLTSESRGRPVDNFIIKDPRLLRIMEREISI